ncbi:uncharacterized protein LOC5509732 [Nematostella vectensis]|uniref:uncharacterized protein LOC5509732 n=1 Tax=Nematostella vectensis TaxID=45351 RepID=UPI0020770AE4|nr:uncharacterized protein LOC5509732 [Nematostella vectensis]
MGSQVERPESVATKYFVCIFVVTTCVEWPHNCLDEEHITRESFYIRHLSNKNKILLVQSLRNSTTMSDANQNGVVENGEEGVARDKTTHDFVTGLKEREELKQQLHTKDREVNTLKGQNYDLMKKIDDLEKQIAELNKDGSKKRKQSHFSKPKRPARRKKPEEKVSEPGKSTHDGYKEGSDPFEDPEKLYAEIAAKYPDMPLSQVLTAEKRFVEADINRDGTIDPEELEKLLDSSSAAGGTALFTRQQIKEIMKQVDLDNTNSIDFMECLGLLDLLRQNRKTGLPPTMQQNVKSAVCNIQ